jgi:hypothetical protein
METNLESCSQHLNVNHSNRAQKITPVTSSPVTCMTCATFVFIIEYNYPFFSRDVVAYLVSIFVTAS